MHSRVVLGAYVTPHFSLLLGRFFSGVLGSETFNLVAEGNPETTEASIAKHAERLIGCDRAYVRRDVRRRAIRTYLEVAHRKGNSGSRGWYRISGGPARCASSPSATRSQRKRSAASFFPDTTLEAHRQCSSADCSGFFQSPFIAYLEAQPIDIRYKPT